MSNLIKNRTELLFLYDIENANPNGDPLNENRPRLDVEDNTILVSDVRLKRTIRDYWFTYRGYNNEETKDIFVREKITGINEKTKKPTIADGKTRAKNFKESAENILDKCIDIRVFGGVIPLSNDSITFLGPTQFQMGRSLHKTDIVIEEGTGAFASTEGKSQSTFRTEYKVNYALIGFNGIINEKAAESSHMTNEDKELLIDGIWEGTKSLISRSKFGQTPIMLLVIDYNEPFYIGNLRQRIQLVSEKMDTKIRSINDYTLDLSNIINELSKYKSKIQSVRLIKDDRLRIKNGDKQIETINLDGLQ